MNTATTLNAPLEQIDSLIKQVAEENGLEIAAALPAVSSTVADRSKQQEESLTSR